MTKVFISFSHKDEKFVKEFHHRLKQAGVDCFCASESIRVGDNWVLELAKELDECKYFVPILTPDFSQSDWCIKETIIFLKADPLSKNRKILPLLRKKCKTPLDLYLEDIQYIDVSSEEKFERNFPEILNQIRGKGRAESQSIKPRKFPLTKDFPHQNSHFSGRDKILKDVRNTFLSGEATQIRQLLCGMAGVGKTQIAIEYAYRHINDYNLIGWIDSEDQTCILKSFQSFAESLPLDREQLLGKKLVELVKQWLENNDGWLLIFDNAEEPKDINEFFPRSKCGHIIITSRHPNWGDWAKSFEILPMEEEEAVEFLKEIINGEDESQIKKLAKELGYLPLALAQAAIYIRNLKESIEDYLTLYRNYTREILERDMKLKDYDKSVASALKLSIRAVESLVSIDGKRKVGSDAVKLLKLFAFLGADNIPHELLTKYHPHNPPVLKDVLGNPYLVNDAIFALQKQSLIDSFRLPEGKFHS
ncbi:MAG: TIR domain-containing protein, partial [Candidatus Aminicenantes bacterium]